MELKFMLADGKIKFVTHKVEWQETRKDFDRETNQMVNVSEDKFEEVYSAEEKDTIISSLAERDIIVTVVEFEQPSAEILASCVGKTFSSYADAVAFVNGEPIPKTELQLLQETVDALILASLEVL